MIAYNATYLENLAIVKKAKQWYANGLISTEQMAAIQDRYKSEFYNPNLFVKIGLFIFTVVLVSAAMGFYSMFFYMLFSSNETGFAIFTCLFFGVGCAASMEVFIKQRKVYRSGIDDALLYCSLSFLFTALGFMFDDALESSNGILAYLLLALPFLAAAVVRYTDRFISLVAALAVYAVFFLLVMKLGEIAKAIMPFALMGLSSLLYFRAGRLKAKAALVHWKDCFTVVECVALLVFYLAGNYLVVRESASEFFGMNLAAGQDIPFAILFYLLTAVVPLAYVFYGLKRKDKVLLWIGLLLVAIAVLTFKYYFSLGHPEITLTVAGVVLMGIAWFSIRYLKTDRYGITFKEEPSEENFLKSNAEALIIAQTYTQGVQTNAPQDTVNMGGGEFGGAGAGGKF